MKIYLGESNAGEIFLVGRLASFWLSGGLPFSASGRIFPIPQ